MMKHDSAGSLRSFPPRRRIFSALLIVFSVGLALAAFGSPVTTSWTYQGRLQRSGAPYNGTCNFQFSLWDAASGGTQNGSSTQSINGVSVVNGLFTVTLDFGDTLFGNYFIGDARWLGTSVQCSGDGGFTPLDPRQPITATPYALGLVPGAEIIGPAFSNIGVRGALNATNTRQGGVGVVGQGKTGVMGLAKEPAGSGVYGGGSGVDSAGVFGENSSGAAIWGMTTGAGPAVYGQATGNGLAGRFIGNVTVEGSLFVNGPVFKSGGTFRIDHPLDPANKFLSHSFVESPDMKNIYDGNVTTDATGSAIVTLPAYFDALNRDFRYQLTVLGQFAQAIVSREIAGNSFEIQTDKPSVKVSWQVTGIRQDAFAQAHPIVVEETKPAEEQGLYLYPAGFGAGEEKRIGHLNRPASEPGARDPSGARPSNQAGK